MFQPFRYTNPNPQPSKVNTPAKVKIKRTEYSPDQAVAPNYLPKMNNLGSASRSRDNSKKATPRSSRVTTRFGDKTTE